MLRKPLILISIFLLTAVLFAIEPAKNELVVTAMVPEDSGVEFPENVIHMDRLYFSFDGTRESLLSSDKLDAGTIEIGINEYRLSLLYYGNQMEDYKFALEVDAGSGWVDGKGNTIPIFARITDSTVTDDITVTESDTGSVSVLIPAKGPRRGENTADIILEWSGSPNLEPGTYTVDLDVYMYAI